MKKTEREVLNSIPDRPAALVRENRIAEEKNKTRQMLPDRGAQACRR
ncbi:hypothetical protein L1S32_02160 [Methanogenium sp. S4BF]|nr:hypothetical protein [Methanogenium sp. S4BF]WFN34945.1 hypothetical protein L1S32_02160 [Methanogenium sp. S4BF]